MTTGELTARVAELEAEVDALLIENHDLREALAVIHHYSAPSEPPCSRP